MTHPLWNDSSICWGEQQPIQPAPEPSDQTSFVARPIDETGHPLPLANTPFLVKRPDFAGEACVAMALRRLRYAVDQEDVFDQTGVDPILGRGSYSAELATAARRIGFEVGPVWYRTDQYSPQQFWREIENDLRANIPSVVCRRSNGNESFVLVIGMERPGDQVIVHNPASPAGRSERIPLASFLRSVQLIAEPRQPATMVRLRMKPGKITLPPKRSTFTPADYCQHIRKLKGKLPNDDFHIVIQPPFVVVGDGGADAVKRSATGTIAWAVERIKKDYFQNDPQHIIDIWLFRDKPSYDKYNRVLFDTEPTTPYGYYSPAQRVLVMNIATGGGTLVHEIVHPFMASNFPRCPSWFNEGLASLYEQSRDDNGHIKGSTNWRLRGLQIAISGKRLPTFESLCSTTRREFYEGASTNYAQARYLCYYLQEKGKLVEYYHAFVKNVRSDPTGYKTLQQVLGRTDMKTFQKEWEAYVMKLRFP